MGIFTAKKTIINFLSSRSNLTIFQCILYGIVGYVMGQYLDWARLALMLLVMYFIQLITRTKAVADGMMFRQIMMDNQVGANDIVKQMKKEMEKMKKDDGDWN
tara:strand:- start:109 stop:417 length:309 start_codon:yes stop_codon:yes gene_type:complete